MNYATLRGQLFHHCIWHHWYLCGRLTREESDGGPDLCLSASVKGVLLASVVPETENSLIPTASPCRLGFWGTQLVQVFLEIILYLWKGANESPGLLVGPIVHTLNSILQEIGNSVIFFSYTNLSTMWRSSSFLWVSFWVIMLEMFGFFPPTV